MEDAIVKANVKPTVAMLILILMVKMQIVLPILKSVCVANVASVMNVASLFNLVQMFESFHQQPFKIVTTVFKGAIQPKCHSFYFIKPFKIVTAVFNRALQPKNHFLFL
jgi:hypothetical protein